MISAPIDETPLPQELPGDYVSRIAENKTHATSTLLQKPDLEICVIVAADTVVVDTHSQIVGSGAKTEQEVYEILGKPEDEAEAARMLRQLRGRTHKVYTGLAVLRPYDGVFLSDICASDVRMRDYGDDEITSYVASGDPMDKAGAYAIQHAGFHPVEELRGCYANVMGLPLCHMAKLLENLDVFPGTDIATSCQQALAFSCPLVDLESEVPQIIGFL